MTLLLHYHDRRYDPVRSDRKVDQANASRETAMRAFFRASVTIMLATVAIAGIIALKTVLYLPHLNY
jgi:type IV secretory pathway component VirB8